MTYSKDSQFTEALDNPEAFEKRLSELRKSRKLSFVGYVFTSLVFFVGCFVALLTYSKINQFGPMTIVIPMMLFASLHQLVAIVAVQGEIRTLLTFKKLKGMQSST